MTKKVLMTATVPSMIGQFNMNNIRILQELGYEVHVACDFKDTSIWTDERTREFQRELHGKGVSYYQIDFSRNPLNIRKELLSYRQMERLVSKEKYALIHCHTPVAGVISRIVAHRRKARVIYTAHGFHFYSGAPLKNWLLFYPIEWMCSWWTDVLITINREDYARAKKRLHAKKTVYVSGTGIDMDKLQSGTVDVERKRAELGLQDDDIMLLSVGELNRNKNHQIVIHAIAELNNTHIHYFIAGKGEQKAALQKLIERLGINRQVHLLGYCTDVPALLKLADLFLLPSLREGLNVSLMEAIACRLPVICSRIRGNVDLVQDNLFDGTCETELVQLLSRIITTRSDLWKAMENSVSKNYDKLKAFDLANVTKSMRRVYKYME